MKTGTLFAMAKFAGIADEQGDFEGSRAAFMVDGTRERGGERGRERGRE